MRTEVPHRDLIGNDWAISPHETEIPPWCSILAIFRRADVGTTRLARAEDSAWTPVGLPGLEPLDADRIPGT